MRQKKLASKALVVFILTFFAICPSVIWAQAPAQTCTGSLSACDPNYIGDTNVWAPLTSTTTQQLNAHDYVDASVWVPSGATSVDICGAIASALTQVAVSANQYSAKAVIDARGVFPLKAVGASSPGTLACAASPWAGFTSTAPPPFAVTILLPAGIINIETTWILPQNTQIIGEGPNATTIQACTASLPNCTTAFAGTDMIDMGTINNGGVVFCPNSPADCNGMALAHLTINGSNIGGLNGIVNTASQEQSYATDVAIQKIASPGVGLLIVGKNDNNLGFAVNSGPYSDIYFSNGTGACVSIQGTYGIRSIRGLTCKGVSGATTAVLLDGSNTTIQDAFISNYPNGIVIGSQGIGAQNNLLFNVAGSSGVTNLIEICAPLSSNTGAPCPATLAVTPSDITLLAISSTVGNTIVDQVTGNTLQHSAAEPSVGLWVVGEPVVGTGVVPNSWFTTSHAFPSWYVGTTAPTGLSCGDSEVGSLFSLIAPSSNTGATLSLCGGTTGTPTWVTLQQ